jgi:uridine kinase
MNAVSIIKQCIPNNDELTVFICGLGGSGKTTLCDEIAMELGGVRIHLDWYLSQRTPDRRESIRKALESHDRKQIEAKENPLNWYDWDKFSADLGGFRKTGKLVISDAWNQRTGEKDFRVEIELTGSKKIWCDGIYMLHPPVARLGDVKVLLQASPESVRRRAEERDNHRSSKEYLAYKDSLMRKYDLPYFEKYAQAANIVVDNTDFENPKLVQL